MDNPGWRRFGRHGGTDRADHRKTWGRCLGRGHRMSADGVPLDFNSKLITPSPDDWRSLFHTYEETVNAPPITMAIEGFLQEESITLIGGLATNGKTLVMLATVQTLLEGGKLFT